MIELRLRMNLALKCRDCLGRALCLWQNFDCFDSPEQLMFGFKYVPHSALANRVDDSVRAQVELGPALFELLDLPTIQVAEVNESLAKRFIGNRFGSNCGTGISRRETGNGIVDLLV